jgi:hypothetical protein
MLLFHRKLLDFCERKLLNPPLDMGYLSKLIQVIDCLAGTEFFDSFNVGDLPEKSIMKHNNLMVFSEHNIKFDQIRSLKPFNDGLHGVFWVNVRSTSMADDNGLSFGSLNDVLQILNDGLIDLGDGMLLN